MAEPKSVKHLERNGTAGSHRLAGSASHGGNGQGHVKDEVPRAPSQEMLGDDARLFQEMSQLSEKNRELLSALGADLATGGEGQTGELEEMRAENAELRRIIAELKGQLEAAPMETELTLLERQKEFDALLEEKSEVIRSLHLKIQEVQEQPPGEPGGELREDELQTVWDELERERTQLDAERRQIEQDRAQLEGDEASLMKQMRDMEMALSRDRAELARQRNELQRLHSDIKHELELASRDASLRDRLGGLQRRHHEATNRRGAAPEAEARPAATAPPPAAPAPAPRKESGLFRRLFGKGK